MTNKRVDLKQILADSDLRRKLMVSTIQATQAREGIQTTIAQANRAYFVVTEGEKASFFDLDKFKGGKGTKDQRHEMFVRSLAGSPNETRFDISRRDFSAIEGAPLAYRRLKRVAPLFRDFPALKDETLAIEQGVASVNIDRYVRCRWEVPKSLFALSQLERDEKRIWSPFAKGGEYSRFYSDVYLVMMVERNWDTMRLEIAEKYPYLKGNASLVIHPDNHYYQIGLTWPLRTQRGFNLRLMPSGCVFGHKGPAIFAKDESDIWTLLGTLNSALIEYVLQCITSFGSFEIGAVRRIPFSRRQAKSAELVADASKDIYLSKARWDSGNEISSVFTVPWLLSEFCSSCSTLPIDLESVLAFEQSEDRRIQSLYVDLNSGVYQSYGLGAEDRTAVEESLGTRPPELIWPQMEGKTVDQKRLEHVWRLLSFAVKRVVEADEDGIVPLLSVDGEVSLIDRMNWELGKLFSGRDVNEVEVEVVNELKRKVKGYDRVESIREWLEDVYFDYHASLYKNRPIFWHISSKQGKGPPAFSALVHCHRFDKDRMAKLRGVYLRDTLGVFRREAALANQEGRAEDRLEWQAKVEETEELDRRLKQVQEGFHEGGEDFRILTPWKTEAERPKGWDPDINDGVKVNIEPLQRAGVLRIAEVV